MGAAVPATRRTWCMRNDNKPCELGGSRANVYVSACVMHRYEYRYEYRHRYRYRYWNLSSTASQHLCALPRPSMAVEFGTRREMAWGAREAELSNSAHVCPLHHNMIHETMCFSEELKIL